MVNGVPTMASKTERAGDGQQRPFLDTIRWLSACMVVLGHAIAIIYTDRDGSRILHHFADLRGPAVMIFFVLSGYLVGGAVLRNTDRFDAGNYFVARFTRIYVVLVPALLLTVMLDGLVYLVNPSSPVFASVWPGAALGNDPIFSRYGWANVIGSALSIEPILGDPIGSAGSLWSLGYEWIFYFLFPGLFFLGKRLGGEIGGHVMVALSLPLVALGSKISAAYWLIWLTGAYAHKIRMAGGAMSLLYGVLTFVCLISAPMLGGKVSVLGVGVCFSLYLSSRNNFENKLTCAADQLLSGMSYSLYVVHLQVQSFAVAMMYELGLLDSRGVSNPIAVLTWVALLVAVSFLVSWGFYLGFERHTGTVRQVIRHWLDTRQRTIVHGS